MRKLAFYLIILIFIVSFNKGLLEIIGINTIYTQILIDSLISIVGGISLIFIVKNKILNAPGIIAILLLLILTFISFLLNDTNLIQMILFFRVFIIHYILFYGMLNIQFEKKQNEIFLKVLIILFLLQIPAAIIKLIIIGGTTEAFIGTMAIKEGSLATIMPLLASVLLISKYLVYKKIKYILLILLFIGIGLISNKLGILFYEIFFFLLLTYFYSEKKHSGYIINTTFLKKMFTTVIYIFIIFVLFVTLNPRANPENKIGGSVDIEYLLNYTKEYNSLKLKGSKVEADGRSDAAIVALEKLSKGGLVNLFIGYGPGDIVKSSFTRFDDPLLEKYNIGYGGRIGFVWMIIQIGIIGTIIFLIFHFSLLYRAYLFFKKTHKLDDNRIFISLTLLSISIVYFIDFFTYSNKMIHSSGVALTYFFAMYYLIQEEKNSINLIKE